VTPTLPIALTGTFINVGAVLAGTAVGVLVGHRLPTDVQRTVMAGLGLVTLVLGIDLALQWRDTNALYVLGAVLLGGLTGELLGIEARITRLGDRLQRRVARGDGRSRISEGFVAASLLFCVGPLTVIGSFEDGLRGDVQTLATKSMLDGFASIALAAALGIGVAFAALSVLIVQGSLTLGAGLLDDVLRGEALAAMTSAGGLLVIGIALRLIEIRDVRVGNFLPALLYAPLLVGLVSLVD
jgi:uncharacterized protein